MVWRNLHKFQDVRPSLWTGLWHLPSLQRERSYPSVRPSHPGNHQPLASKWPGLCLCQECLWFLFRPSVQGKKYLCSTDAISFNQNFLISCSFPPWKCLFYSKYFFELSGKRREERKEAEKGRKREIKDLVHFSDALMIIIIFALERWFNSYQN